jgi:hypothetical protein
VTFEDVNGTWKVTKPLEAEAEHNDLGDLLNDVSPLRVAEWVAEKPTPAQLKEYGLDPPEAQWRYFENDKDVALDLLVGKRGKDPATCYAKLAKGDQVFLLDAKATRRLFAEYRSRKVWTEPLTPAEVVSLSYKRGPQTFTLTKLAGSWVVAEKPGEKVKADAVAETLTALANLRADHYAADKDAKPDFYGLANPAVVIEIQVRGEPKKRVLKLGGLEDKVRRYLQPPQEGRTDVMVISEADTAKIDRELSAFVESGPK